MQQTLMGMSAKGTEAMKRMDKNLEGEMVVDFAKIIEMAEVNNYFQKREEHRVKCNSGGRNTQRLTYCVDDAI